jgi:DNA primase
MQNSNYFDDIFIEEVKNANNIVDVISKFVDLKKNGDNYKGLCPFHNEKTPSFVVNENKQIFKCFGCGEGGNVISFLMKKENMSFGESLKYLCENANIPYKQTHTFTEKEKKELDEKEKMYKLHVDLAKYYLQNLQKNLDDSKGYLLNRGIDERTMKKFGLGYEDWNSSSINYLKELGYTKEEMIHSMVFREKNDRMYSIFFGRIMYPIIDRRNRVIAFGGRTMSEAQSPKYLNSPESIIFKKKNELYGLNLANKYNSKRLILVEGYMDVISLIKNGIAGGIASLGTSLAKEHVEVIKRQNKKVFICYDSDTAGRKATLRALEMFDSEGITANIIRVGDYKDPDEFFANKKSLDFMSLIKNAVSPLTFIIDDLALNYDLSVHSQKLEFINLACEKIVACKDEVEKEYQIKRLSQMTNTSIKAIGVKVYGEFFSPKRFEEQEKNVRVFQKEQNIPKKVIKISEKISNPNEEKLKKMLIENPSNIKFVDDILELEDLKDVDIRKIYIKRFEYERGNIDSESERLLRKLAKSVKFSSIQSQIEEIDILLKDERDIEKTLENAKNRIELLRKMSEIKESLKLDV